MKTCQVRIRNYNLSFLRVGSKGRLGIYVPLGLLQKEKKKDS